MIDAPHVVGVDAFLERAGELGALADALGAVSESHVGRVALVAGEAGAGKTALVRRFRAACPGSVRVLWGACEPLLMPPPFGPFLDLAAAVGGELQELMSGGLRPNELAEALMADLRRRPGTLVVLEDLHWADGATLDALMLLGRRAASVPALIVVTFRDDELDRATGLRIVLGELAGSAQRVTVHRLSRAAVDELAGPAGIDGALLYRATGGNAFFVTEVLGSGDQEVPGTVRDAVLARTARLAPEAQTLLEAVAIIPGPAPLWLLAELVPEQIAQLDDCLRSGIVTSGSGWVGFRHEIARLVVEAAIAPNRRIALHRRALSASVAHADDAVEPARLAHHAEAADDRAAVLRWAPEAAGLAAAAGAHREAAAQYARALRCADDEPSAVRAALLERRAMECYMTDQFDEALAAQRGALEEWRRAGDPRGEGDALRSLSRVLRFTGRTSEAEDAARGSVALLEELGASHELALAYCNLSHLMMNAEDADGALAWGTRALELAHALDDAEARVYAMTNIGVVEYLADTPDRAATLERALALARSGGFEEHAGRAFLSLVLWPLRHRDLALVHRHLEPGLDYCTEHGLDTWRLYLLACRARLELDLGHWDVAADCATLVVRDDRSAPAPRGWALAALGLLRARRGDPGAAELLDEARDLAEPTGELQRIGPAATARAEAAWLSGEPDRIPAETDAALELAGRRGSAWLAGELACWRWRAGVHEVLGIEVAEPFARTLAGDHAGAAQWWERLGCRYEAALARVDAGDEPTVRDAHEALVAIGARPAAAIVGRRLRDGGASGVRRGPRPGTKAHPAGLTAREVDVLALLADGLRNADIAERLVVSDRTVAHHVSAILRKLGARTRGEAAAEAVRRGLIGPT